MLSRFFVSSLLLMSVSLATTPKANAYLEFFESIFQKAQDFCDYGMLAFDDEMDVRKQAFDRIKDVYEDSESILTALHIQRKVLMDSALKICGGDCSEDQLFQVLKEFVGRHEGPLVKFNPNKHIILRYVNMPNVISSISTAFTLRFFGLDFYPYIRPDSPLKIAADSGVGLVVAVSLISNHVIDSSARKAFKAYLGTLSELTKAKYFTHANNTLKIRANILSDFSPENLTPQEFVETLAEDPTDFFSQLNRQKDEVIALWLSESLANAKLYPGDELFDESTRHFNLPFDDSYATQINIAFQKMGSARGEDIRLKTIDYFNLYYPDLHMNDVQYQNLTDLSHGVYTPSDIDDDDDDFGKMVMSTGLFRNQVDVIRSTQKKP